MAHKVLLREFPAQPKSSHTSECSGRISPNEVHVTPVVHFYGYLSYITSDDGFSFRVEIEVRFANLR